MYNVFVERGNVAVLQCGVPASVRDSVEVRKIPEEIAIRRLERSECVFKYAEAGGGRVNVLSVWWSRISSDFCFDFCSPKHFTGTGAGLVEGGPAREGRASLRWKVTFPLESLLYRTLDHL